MLGILRSPCFRLASVQLSCHYSKAAGPRLKTRIDILIKEPHKRSAWHPTEAQKILRAEEKRKKAREAQIFQNVVKTQSVFLDRYFSNINNVLSGPPKLDVRNLNAVILAYLGTNRDQVKDGGLVMSDVRKLLNANEPGKAMYMAKLAGRRGLGSFHSIIRYLSENGQHSTSLRVFNVMKKWGIEPSESTFTVLSNAAAMSKDVTPSGLKRVLELNEQSLPPRRKLEQNETAKSVVIRKNSALKALCRNAASPTEVFQALRDFAPTGFVARDNITYSTVFNYIATEHGRSDINLRRERDDLWKELNEREQSDQIDIDSGVVRAYCNTLAQDNHNAANLRLLETVSRFFFLEGSEDEAFRYRDGTSGEKMAKFALREGDLSIIMQSFINVREFELGAQYFQQYSTLPTVKLDRPLNNLYLNCLANIGGQESALDTIKKMHAQKDDEKCKPNNASFFLFFQSYIKCPIKEVVLADVEYVLSTIVPDCGIKLNSMMLLSYISIYTRMSAMYQGLKPEAADAIIAIKVAQKNLEVVSDVSRHQKRPVTVRKALTNISKLCSFAFSHRDFNDLSLIERQKEFGWIEEFRLQVRKLLTGLKSNFPETDLYDKRHAIHKKILSKERQQEKKDMVAYNRTVKQKEQEMRQYDLANNEKTLMSKQKRRRINKDLRQQLRHKQVKQRTPFWEIAERVPAPRPDKITKEDLLA